MLTPVYVKVHSLSTFSLCKTDRKYAKYMLRNVIERQIFECDANEEQVFVQLRFPLEQVRCPLKQVFMQSDSAQVPEFPDIPQSIGVYKALHNAAM